MEKTRSVRYGQRGFVLVTLYMVLVILLILGGTLVTQALAEMRGVQRLQASTQALFLAEAGVDRALQQLRQDYNWVAGYPTTALGGMGSYQVVPLEVLGANRKRIVATGSGTLFSASVDRSVECIVRKWIPASFYDNVLWASQNVDFNGNAYNFTGDIRHGDTTPAINAGRILGTVTYDPSTNPLPRLAFPRLYQIAQAQNNVYDAVRIGNGHGVFPTSFWYTPPTNPADPTTGVPNVNYVTADLVLNGDIGTIGGFFVVVGDVLTDPSNTQDTTLNGNGQIEGAIYTTGSFRINGGGGGLNIHGGVWTGNEGRVNGNTTMTYFSDYMRAIQALDINGVQVVSWRDLAA